MPQQCTAVPGLGSPCERVAQCWYVGAEVRGCRYGCLGRAAPVKAAPRRAAPPADACSICLSTTGGLTFTATLLLANATCAAWLAVYHWMLEAPEDRATQLWRHHSADLGGAAAGGSHAEGGAGSRVAEPQRRRESRSQDGTPQVPVLVEAAGAAERAGPGGDEGGSEEEQQLLAGNGAGGTEQQQRGRDVPPDLQGEGSIKWKPSMAARMTWRERLQRTGAGDDELLRAGQGSMGRGR